MADITLSFDDGSKHVYQNAPDALSPADVYARAQKDFPDRAVKAIARGAPPLTAAPAPPAVPAAPTAALAPGDPGFNPVTAIAASEQRQRAQQQAPVEQAAAYDNPEFPGAAQFGAAVRPYLPSTKEIAGSTLEAAQAFPPDAAAMEAAAALGAGAIKGVKALPGAAASVVSALKGAGDAAIPAVERVADTIAQGASYLGNKLAQPFRVVSGTSAKESLNKLADSIRSGKFSEDLLKPSTEATEARIRLLQQHGEITQAQAEQAVQQLTASSHGAAAAERQVADTAAYAAGQVRKTLESAPSTPEIGAEMLGNIKRWYDGVRGSRASVAEAAYGDATDAMQARHAAGDVWQQSPSGQQFLSSLRDKLSLEGGTKVSEEERSLLTKQLLPNLEGRRVPAQGEQLRSTEEGPEVVPAQEGEIAYSQPNVLRETLRKLRDAASGRPEEGYAAIGQQRAGQLANDLAASIAEWEPSLAQADAKYRQMSELLEPAKTALGTKALKGEKFDVETPAADPASLPGLFFKTPKTVQQLVALNGGDVASVEQTAANYAFSQLAKAKDAAAARAWAAKNADWLKTLPNAERRVEAQVAQLEKAEADISQVTEQRGLREKDVAERRKAITETARQAQDRIASEAKLVASAQQQLREPFDLLEAQIANGALPKQRLASAVRNIILEKSQELPADVVQAWAKKLDEIDRLQSRDAQYLAIQRWTKRAAMTAAGLGGLHEVGREIGAIK